MRKILLQIFFILALLQTASSQDHFIDSLRTEYDKLYGSDILLNNGRKYIPTTTQAKGHPFLNQGEFIGAITISGSTFPNQKLKYEINKQIFLLNYLDRNNQNYQLILNSVFIDSVRTVDAIYIRNTYPEIKQPFVLLIYDGGIKCLLAVHKDLDFTSMGVTTGYSYSKEIKDYYLVVNEKVHQFTNKASFLKLFPAGKRSQIRARIAQLQLKFRKIDDQKMKKLIEYCDRSLTEKGNTL